MLTSQLPDLSQIPARYDNLSGIFPKAPVLDLSNELRWIAARVRGDGEKVEKFLFIKGLVEHATIEGNYSSALTALDALHEAYGATLWSVQLRLALEQQVGGLEQQKKYSAQVRSVYKQGLLGYITYHTSVRNEERTTIAKFTDDIERRISNHAYYDDATRTYMRYRLKNELPATEAHLADILRIEQSHGVLDLYETFVATLQEVVRWKDHASLHKVIVECIDAANIPDHRLQKVRLILSPERASTLPPRAQELSNAIFSGSVNKALKIALRDVSVDPWQIIYASFAYASSQRPPRKSLCPQTLHRWVARSPGCARGIRRLRSAIGQAMP